MELKDLRIHVAGNWPYLKLLFLMFSDEIACKSMRRQTTGAPNENIVQNHLNTALLNVF